MDQNKKLVMFGVVYVMAIDGYSRKTVDLITLPNKNATAIYNTLMRSCCSQTVCGSYLGRDHGIELAFHLLSNNILVIIGVSSNGHPTYRPHLTRIIV